MRAKLSLLFTLATVAVAEEPLRQLPAEALQRAWATERATAQQLTITGLVERVVHLDDDRLAVELETGTAAPVRCEVLEPVNEQAEDLEPGQLVALRGVVVSAATTPQLERCSLTFVGLPPKSSGTKRAEQATLLLRSRELCEGTELVAQRAREAFKHLRAPVGCTSPIFELLRQCAASAGPVAGTGCGSDEVQLTRAAAAFLRSHE